MKAGSLDRSITVERLSTNVDDYGIPVETWTQVAALRAQMITNSLKDFLNQTTGSTSNSTIVFRSRFIPGLTLDNRVTYAGEAFRILELKEIGRRRGLELRCERIGK